MFGDEETKIRKSVQRLNGDSIISLIHWMMDEYPSCFSLYPTADNGPRWVTIEEISPTDVRQSPSGFAPTRAAATAQDRSRAQQDYLGNLAGRPADPQHRDAAPNAQESELQKILSALRTEIAGLQGGKAALKTELTQMQQRKETLVTELAALQNQKAALEAKETSLQQREAKVNEKEAVLQQREADVDAKEQDLQQREADVTTRAAEADALFRKLQDDMKRSNQPNSDAVDAARESLQLSQNGSAQIEQMATLLVEIHQQFTDVADLYRNFATFYDKQQHTKGLRQLAAQIREMECTDDPWCTYYAKKLCTSMAELFGCAMIDPQAGEPFDGTRMDQKESRSLPADPRVQTCAAVGWQLGEQVLLRAVVTLREEEM